MGACPRPSTSLPRQETWMRGTTGTSHGECTLHRSNSTLLRNCWFMANKPRKIGEISPITLAGVIIGVTAQGMWRGRWCVFGPAGWGPPDRVRDLPDAAVSLTHGRTQA